MLINQALDPKIEARLYELTKLGVNRVIASALLNASDEALAKGRAMGEAAREAGKLTKTDPHGVTAAAVLAATIREIELRRA